MNPAPGSLCWLGSYIGKPGAYIACVHGPCLAAFSSDTWPAPKPASSSFGHLLTAGLIGDEEDRTLLRLGQGDVQVDVELLVGNQAVDVVAGCPGQLPEQRV